MDRQNYFSSSSKPELSAIETLYDKKQSAQGRQQTDRTTASLHSKKQTVCKDTPPIIYWQNCQAEQIILNLRIHGKYVKPHTSFQHDMGRELNDLLRCLFFRAQTILVEPLSCGFSNTRVVKVHPFYAEGGVGRVVVVKFGDAQIIEQEYECYQNYVQYFVGDGRSTAILDHQYTSHMGGIIYSFLGTETQQLQSFGAFYQQASIEAIKQTLDWLFRSTCRIWYANHSSLQFLNLTEEYQKQSSYSFNQLRHFIGKRFPEIVNQEKLTFQFFPSERTYTFLNPFHTLKTLQPQIYSTYQCITHGDFNPGNIFVDQAGHPWLIDFQSTGPSHILRDVATLDAVIRLQLLTSKQATLDECLALEEALCSITNFHQLATLKKSYSTANPALTKTWETLVHLRTIAHWLIEKKPSHDTREYYAALFYVTMNTLSFSSLEEMQCEHALISASLLTDMLR